MYPVHIYHYCLTLFIYTASSTPTQFNATYKSLTNIVLEWTYDIPISTGYTYVVYYQQAQSEGGGHFNVSFNINKNADNMYKYSLTDIPDGNVYSISIVATRALSPSLPSPVVGPITPSKYTLLYGSYLSIIFIPIQLLRLHQCHC